MRPLRRTAGLSGSGAMLAVAVAAALAVAVAVAQDEVPFVTTPDAVTLTMLELAEVGAADHVVDLGSGDGRIVIAAARRFGASGLGVEIVPDLVARSRVAARAAGVERRAVFREQDLFAVDLASASVVTLYLLPDVNLQLRPRLLALTPGTRVVSHDWDMGDWTPDRTVVVPVPDKALGRDKSSRVHLWRVPARVAGRWCAVDGELDVTQRFQRFSAAFRAAGTAAPPRVLDGRIEGRRLIGEGLSVAVYELDGDGHGDGARLTEAGSGTTPARTFRPAAAGRCDVRR